MTTDSKTILLWSPVSNHGHLNMYLEIYGSVLTSLGYSVFYYADLEESFATRLRKVTPDLKSIESVVPEKILKRWGLEWIFKVARNVMKQKTISTIDFIRGLIPQLSSTFRKHKSFVDFGVLTRKLEVLNEIGFKPNLVICMYLDMTFLGSKSRRVLRKLSVPWIGLLFHPEELDHSSEFSKNSWFWDKSNRGAILFSGTLIGDYNQISRSNQSFVLLPDVTRVPSVENSSYVLDLISHSQGKKIVGLIGAIDGEKKLIQEFLELSGDSRLKDYFFVMVGEVYESTLDSLTLNKIRNLTGNATEELFVLDRYIESEVDFDSLFSQIDILFACYKNFDSSANILAKSASFKKPVIVTGGTWIGRLTEQYNLGLTVSDFRTDTLVDAIQKVGEVLDTSPNTFGFGDYLEIVSIENLRVNLGQYLTELWNTETSK
jgi:hypothetical protein